MASGDKPGGGGRAQRYGAHGRYVAAGTSATSTDPALGFAQIAAAHPKVDIIATRKRHADQPTWAIDRLEVDPGERGQGLASAALRDLTTYADALGITLALTPEQTGAAGGLSTAALRKWYGRHGFKPNRGKYPDITESMVRPPETTRERGAAPMTDTMFRSFTTTLERTERTLDGLFVPWDVAADVADVEMGADGPRVRRYREGFQSGAFDRQVNTSEPGVIRRIVLRDQHRDGLGKLGHVVSLRNEPNGLHGTVSILPSRMDDVESLYDEGIDGLSLEFHPLSSATTDGVTWRTRAHLVAVALEAQPAYADARVLSLRASDEIAVADAEVEALRRAELDELDAWLASARCGVDRFVPK